jgi:hypothetical protein
MYRETVVGVASILILQAMTGPTLAMTFPSPPAVHQSAQLAGWDRCKVWQDNCTWRWGLGTWRYERCLRRHGC